MTHTQLSFPTPLERQAGRLPAIAWWQIMRCQAAY